MERHMEDKKMYMALCYWQSFLWIKKLTFPTSLPLKCKKKEEKNRSFGPSGKVFLLKKYVIKNSLNLRALFHHPTPPPLPLKTKIRSIPKLGAN